MNDETACSVYRIHDSAETDILFVKLILWDGNTVLVFSLIS